MTNYKTLTKYFENDIPTKDFKVEAIINTNKQKCVLGIITYKKATFFYFLFVNQKKEKRILVLNPISPMRYTKRLDSHSFKNSFLWVCRKYCFITNDYK